MMGRDYDLIPIDLGGEISILVDRFIQDWIRNFHDKHSATTTASQWALYEFVDDIQVKLGLVYQGER